MKQRCNKTMYIIIKEMLVVLLTSIVNGPNHTKCVSLSNEKCMIQSTLTVFLLISTGP